GRLPGDPVLRGEHGHRHPGRTFLRKGLAGLERRQAPERGKALEGRPVAEDDRHQRATDGGIGQCPGNHLGPDARRITERDADPRTVQIFFSTTAALRRVSMYWEVSRSACCRRRRSSISGRSSASGFMPSLRISSSFSTCQPNCVRTGSETSPLLRLKATRSNSGTIVPRLKKPRSPPSDELPPSLRFFA